MQSAAELGGIPDQRPSRDAARTRFAQLGVPEHAIFPASWLYQQHSRLSPEWECPLDAGEVARLTCDLDYKQYPGAWLCELPKTPDLEDSIEAVIRHRRTASGFGPAHLDLGELAKLLELGCGLTEQGSPPLRAAPSPGALYPIESYALVFDVSGLPAGLYHYAPIKHTLEYVRSIEARQELESALPQGWSGEMPALAIVLTARLHRVQAKYSERAYRFALIECGHIAQNLLLASASLGLAAAPVGGFFDDAMNALIGIDGAQEPALYAVLIGRPGAGNTPRSIPENTDMSSTNLDAILGRAVRDKEFRQRLFTEPEAVAREYNMAASELEALQNFDQDAADEFFDRIIGGRIVMACTDKVPFDDAS